jgi:hypothetical protein
MPGFSLLMAAVFPGLTRDTSELNWIHRLGEPDHFRQGGTARLISGAGINA